MFTIVSVDEDAHSNHPIHRGCSRQVPVSGEAGHSGAGYVTAPLDSVRRRMSPADLNGGSCGLDGSSGVMGYRGSVFRRCLEAVPSPSVGTSFASKSALRLELRNLPSLPPAYESGNRARSGTCVGAWLAISGILHRQHDDSMLFLRQHAAKVLRQCDPLRDLPHVCRQFEFASAANHALGLHCTRQPS